MNDATGRSIKSLPALANQWWLLDCCVYTVYTRSQNTGGICLLVARWFYTGTKTNR